MKRVSIYIIVISVVLLCIIMGCQNNDLSGNNVKIYSEFKTKYTGIVKELTGFEGQTYLDMGLWNDSKCLHNTTINLDFNKSFECFLALTNNLGETYNFTLVIFDNYEQIDFNVDDEILNQCTVKVHDSSTINIPIKINSLEKGKHDFVFAVFVNTYDYLSVDERLIAGRYDSQLRSIVIVDSKTEFMNEFVPCNIKAITARTNGVIFNKLNGSDYSLEIGNLDDEIQECAIILLDNFEQVDLSKSSGDPYLYVKLNPEEEIVIPMEEYLDDKDKNHEYSAICIRNAGDNGENFLGNVFFSNRILY